jgi:hypothetical protein
MDRDLLLAILKAYRTVQSVWPTINPGLEARASTWEQMDARALSDELARQVEQSNRPGCDLRLFWKLGTELTYGGCNARFAQDAGFPAPAQLVGRNDFDHAVTWLRQSPKYRADDLEVINLRTERLNIIERQRSAQGNIWLRTAKAPICPAGGGSPVGVFGMYEIIDVQMAIQLNPALGA